MKTPLKSACSKEEVVQLDDASRKCGRHADGKEVVITNLGCFSICNTGILS